MVVLKIDTDKGSPWKTPTDKLTGLAAHSLEMMMACW